VKWTGRRRVNPGLKWVGTEEFEPLENWTSGLSLIALTMAIHATGIAFMAFTTLRIRHWMESLSRLRLHHWFAIAVAVIGVVGLLLAALRGIEAAV